MARGLRCLSGFVSSVVVLAGCTGQIGPSGPPSGLSPGSAGAAPGAGVTGPSNNMPGSLVLPSVAPSVPRVPTARLSRLSWTQWVQNTTDLLRLPDLGGLETSVDKDPVPGFDNTTVDLLVTDALRSELEHASETLAARVAQDSTLLSALMPPNAPTAMPDRATAFITTFGARAYRRPLGSDEVASYLTLFQQAPSLFPGVDPFAAGVQLTLQLFLQSPHYLYRTELQTGSGIIPLSDYEVAAKLSLTLTNSLPDDELSNTAAAGNLHTPDAVKVQVERLLSLPSGRAGLDHFNFQILRLGTYDGITRDPVMFPEFSPQAPAAMAQEALLFMEWIFDQRYGVHEIYTKPVTFVNNLLAPLYGLQGTFTSDFTRVDLDPTQRAGLLTQLGFLTSYEHGADPDSIHRGVYVNTRVLCVSLPPPSPLATPLPPEDPTKTNRQLIEEHTGNGTCGQGCHSTLINPAGFAFENFDVIGKYRTTDRGQPIDASGTYPFVEPPDVASLSQNPDTWPQVPTAHTSFGDFSEQVADSSQANDCYVAQWFQYIKARDAAPVEIPLLNYYGALSRAASLPVHDLVMDLVSSSDFLSRIDEASP
jgi:hypothetical protein